MSLKKTTVFLNRTEHCWATRECHHICLFLPESHGKRIRLISLSNQKGSVSRNSHQHVFCLSPTQVTIVPTTTVKNQNGQRITKLVKCHSVGITCKVINNTSKRYKKNSALDLSHLATYDSSLLQNIVTQQLILDESIKNRSEHLACLK